MSTRAEILNGALFEGYEDFCAEVVNAIITHYRVSDPCVNMVARQPGEILSDPDDDKLYHVGGASGYPCDEILQASRSCDVIPDFKGVDFYSSCNGDYATIRGINEPGLGHRLTIGLDGTSRAMVICDLGDVDVDFGLAAVNFPTTYWMDADHDSYFMIGWDSDDLPKLEVGGTAVKIGIYSDLFTDRWLEQNSNTFIGINVVGAGNLAHGADNEGYRNSAFGNYAFYSNTLGHSNSAFGYGSLTSNTLGWFNSAFGYYSGRYQNDGTTPLQTPENSVYLGALTKSGSDPAGGEDAIDNEIVIGYNAIGFKSDTVTLGNDSITDTILKGMTNINNYLTRKYVGTVDDVDGNETHLIAVMLGGLIRRGTGNQLTANRTDISDTAANIVAAIKNCIVGSGFEFSIANEDGTHTVALSGGVGVTMIPNAPSTAIPVLSTGRFLAIVTNVTAAAEAVNIHALGYSIH